MNPDRYVRIVLTIIAAALVYLCVVLTPLPGLSAQGTRVPGTRTPGESTGPGEVVIVGWRGGPDAFLPVGVVGRVSVAGDVQVTNPVRVTGRVETQQAPQTFDRVAIAGWEATIQDGGNRRFAPLYQSALPVIETPSRR